MQQVLAFGVLLRKWRVRRRMTQMDLAIAADSSTRHLSCLETGRSRASREMVLRLCEHLAIPLRDRNTLFLAAGFAPAYQERSVNELATARAAIERIVQAHSPYPAYALDRHWNVVFSNGALPQLYEGCSPELLRRPICAVRLLLHPLGMGSRIVNYHEWRGHTVSVLQLQIQIRPEPSIEALLAEISSYPAPSGSRMPAMADAPISFAMPLQIATRLGVVSFLSTTTVFGTPTDVTLSELAMEMLFPADDATVGVVQAIVAENSEQPSQDAYFVHAG